MSGGAREERMVPEAEFDSYYGRPIIKPPVWKVPDVPFYLFVGGMAGGSSLLAEGAALRGLPALEKVARFAAAGGAMAGTVALVHDLGRPERFLNMLRVFKPTSPLSMGSYILAPFATFSGIAAGTQVLGKFRLIGRLAGAGAALFGPTLATYTAALLANTAVPSWHEAHQELPFVFGGSGAMAAGGLGLLLVPTEQAAPARRMGVLGVALEVGASELMERRLGHLLAEPYRTGKAGRLLKVARGLALGGAALSVLGRRNRVLSAIAGAAMVAGSQVLRFGVFEAGMVSARDPKYTVIPQKERLRRKQEAAAAAGTPAPSAGEAAKDAAD